MCPVQCVTYVSGRSLDQEVTEAEFWYCCIVVQLGNVKKNSCSKTTRKHRLN
jgi:hypothetical protein